MFENVRVLVVNLRKGSSNLRECSKTSNSLRLSSEDLVFEIPGMTVSFKMSLFKLTSEIVVVICTRVTLFALVFHLNRTALSRSESSNFFRCINNKTKGNK